MRSSRKWTFTTLPLVVLWLYSVDDGVTHAAASPAFEYMHGKHAVEAVHDVSSGLSATHRRLQQVIPISVVQKFIESGYLPACMLKYQTFISHVQMQNSAAVGNSSSISKPTAVFPLAGKHHYVTGLSALSDAGCCAHQNRYKNCVLPAWTQHIQC